MNRIIFQIALATAVVMLVGWIVVFEDGRKAVPGERTAGTGALRVVATIYPLAALAGGVTGPDGGIVTIVPAGAEPHDYEPTARDIISIRGADVFLLNGAGVDRWAEDLRGELEASGVRVIALESHAERIAVGEESFDPHFWLDPVAAQSFVAAVRDVLAERDPAGAAAYEANARETLDRLAGLDRSYRLGLASCAKDKIIVSHDAFAYLAQRYGFEVYPISGVSPEAEPSTRRIAELALLAEKENIRYIFFETLVSPKVSETLAREVGAETLVFDPIEGLSAEDASLGKDYFSIMESNLANLSKALECRK